MEFKIKNIEWDIEDESLLEKLPTTIDLSDKFIGITENKLFRWIDDSIREKVSDVLKGKGYDFDVLPLEDWDYELKW